jgi:hypothetical protein
LEGKGFDGVGMGGEEDEEESGNQGGKELVFHGDMPG